MECVQLMLCKEMEWRPLFQLEPEWDKRQSAASGHCTLGAGVIIGHMVNISIDRPISAIPRPAHPSTNQHKFWEVIIMWGKGSVHSTWAQHSNRHLEHSVKNALKYKVGCSQLKCFTQSSHFFTSSNRLCCLNICTPWYLSPGPASA